jgi:hypothetical protein
LSDPLFSFSVDAGDLMDRLTRFRAGAILSEVADTVRPGLVAALKLAAPQHSGRLARSIRVERSTRLLPTTEVSLRGVTSVPYARFVLEGTAPHPIAAVNAQSLRWYDQMGDPVFRRAVQHPGTRPNDFPKRVWRSMREPIMAELVAQIRAKL